MRKFYLVGRGKLNQEFVKSPGDCRDLLSYNGLIDPDYMGSAEFEFGAVPKFYRRVMQRIEKDNKSYQMVNLKKLIGLKTEKGSPFWAFVHNPDMDDFLAAMSDYIDDLKCMNKIHKWQLKEYSAIEYHLDGSRNLFGLSNLPDAWYSIDDINNYYIGDWFMMIGNNAANAFNKVIMNDYNEWWLTLSEEIRNENYHHI